MEDLCFYCRYVELCPHGVTTGSKFLYLAESVRDPIDLKLSKEFMSPTNVLDTACTAAAHLILRDKKTADLLFGERRACFEKPVRDRKPEEISIPSLAFQSHLKTQLSLPPKNDLNNFEDPKTRSTEKYFCGDRFHDIKFPHKSELCRYHDINLVPELKAARTSEQENINSRRNRLRLRSACTQNLGTHLFYNGVIMDRAHNRAVVEKQAEGLLKPISSRHPEYMHIV